MEEVACEICGSTEYKVLFDKLWHCEKFNIDKRKVILFFNELPVNFRNVCCDKCGLVYINPRMTDEETLEFYKKQYRETPQYNVGEHINSHLRFSRGHLGLEIYNAVTRCDFLEKLGYLKQGINTLDVGSSLGALPAYLKSKGCNAYGVELSQFAGYTKDLFGIDTIFRVPFEELNTDIKFDIVTICDALEHFSHPKNILLKTRGILKDDGIVLIEVPDIFKPHKSLFAFFSNAHFYTFSPSSIKNLLNICGFEIFRFEYGGHCMNMRIIAKKGESKKVQFKDSCESISDFLLKYGMVYEAKEKYRNGNLSYEAAVDIVKKKIPEYNVIDYIEAFRLCAEDKNISRAKELLLKCVLSDFNEEDISIQKGNIYASLAVICFNTGDIAYARYFMKRAFELLPRLYDFPYLAELKEREVFDIDKFVHDRSLLYTELFKLQKILDKG